MGPPEFKTVRGCVGRGILLAGGGDVVVGGGDVVVGEGDVVIGGGGVVIGEGDVVVGEGDVVFCAWAGVVDSITSCKAKRSIRPLTSTRAASTSILNTTRGMIAPFSNLLLLWRGIVASGCDLLPAQSGIPRSFRVAFQ